MHVVHQKSGSSGNADILVIAVFFEIGSASNFLMSLGLPGGEPFPVIGAPLTLDSELLLAMADGLYMYSGSLTTPPCSETVTWVVLAKPRTASQVQIDEAQNYYPEPANHRPLQPLNGRKIGKNMFAVTSPASWCKDFDLSLLDKSSKADCKKQQQKAYYENHRLWEQRSRAVSGKRIADISISSVMFLLLGILGATSLVAWRRGAWSRPAPLSDPGDGFLLSETDGFLSSDELVA
ncbi:unnamed protein product [Polarella glacialis]|uniref:carbonic anhydrase n=1 Tax=Polarella glacialis TaxID=89957 RepID=A0A813E8Y4_POLGL|nr:unnamed protein product [Polarella glacialis]